GAALAVSDEVTAWFCHGLEERLRAGENQATGSREALAELAEWRGILGELLVAPERALETLPLLSRQRSSSQPAHGVPPPPPPRVPTAEPPNEAEAPRSQASDDATLRVPTATLDRLFERVRQFGQARAQLLDEAEMVHALASIARSLRMGLSEALRLIGPPR